MHLKEEQLIDLAECVASEEAFPHLASCDSCRRQLIDLRAAMASVADVNDGPVRDVAEPPPFFWTQLQNRVTEAVDRESSRSFLGRWLLARPPALVPLSAFAVLVIMVTLGFARWFRPFEPTAHTPAAVAVNVEPLEDVFSDPSLQLVADLADSMDVTAESEAGLATAGSAEHAVAHLSAPELQELQRILRAELGT
jgi:hypothetical protein